MNRNPYRIDGPAAISVSGGRTSAFMLRNIMDAHGGVLPENVVPLFFNTGLEHEATYNFLRDIDAHWGTEIIWLEFCVFRDEEGISKMSCKEVDFCSASRNGEPFNLLIEHKKWNLPNPVQRMCTGELKVKTGTRWCKSKGWAEWDHAVGLRADEPRRAAKIKSESAAENVILPMYSAGHSISDVDQFWKGQDFGLDLPGGDNRFGNCVGCFLKSRSKLDQIMRTNPEHFDWWMAAEAKSGTVFRRDRPSYRQMMTQLSVQGQMFDDAIEDDTLPCMCHD